MITATITTNFDKALELNQEITGTYFYECYENSKRDPGADKYYVAEDGTIYYVYEIPDSYDKGMKILHKLTLGASISSAGFNTVMVIENEGIGHISISDDNYENNKHNRKIFAKHGMTVTTEAAA